MSGTRDKHWEAAKRVCSQMRWEGRGNKVLALAVTEMGRLGGGASGDQAGVQVRTVSAARTRTGAPEASVVSCR